MPNVIWTKRANTAFKPTKETNVLYPKHIEDRLNFEIIRQRTAGYCVSEKARETAKTAAFSNDFDTVVHRLQQTDEMKHIIQFEEHFPSGFFPDSDGHFSQKERAGSYFTESELMELKASLENMRQLIRFFNHPKTKDFPALKSLLPNSDFAGFIIDSVNGILNRHGEIKDNASPDLMSIRRDLDNKKSSISKTLNRIIAQAQSDGILDSDTQAVMREGKLLIPVAASHKRRIKGIVYDMSASGQTGYIEPYEVSELNNAVRELEMAEKREMLRILTDITKAFKPFFPDILQAYAFLAKIDFIKAKAKLAVELNAVLPIMHNKPFTEFRQAGHPLLLLAYKNRDDKSVVRSDIRLNAKKRMMIISGPNAGGKSVSLKTTGILQYMLQCGFLIPVKATSETGIYKSLFLDIGDQQSVEDDLSTYSSHLLNMKVFTEQADADSLVLIDEMGSGTEPHLGAAIAEAVLEKLLEKQVKAVITTHYANLKAFGENASGAFNAAMLFDKEKLSPLYELEIGKPGSSFAFEIARKTGLSSEILKSAEAKTDRQQLDFEDILQKTIAEKRKLRRSKRKIQAEEQEISELKSKYRKGAEYVFTEKKKILEEARKEADKILQEANKKIENTIAEIRKVQAEKELTKELRAELEAYKENFRNDISEKEEKIERRIKKVSKPEKENVQKHSGPLQTGDYVKLEGQRETGRILEMKGKQAVISVGNLRMTVKINQLKRTNAPTPQKSVHKPRLISEKESSDGSELFGIDVRGKRAEEALSAVRQYLDKALMSRTRHIKILHGTGNGILRQVIREYLAGHELVKSFRDERLEAGGHGITLAELDF